MLLERLLDTLEEATLEEVRVGAFWTATIVSRAGRRRCGLASTMSGGGLHHIGPPVQWAGHLLQHSSLELAHLVLSDQAIEASIGMATINALLQVDESRCHEENALYTLQHEGAGKRVALVGHFPFVPRLRPAVGALDVLELRPGLGDIPAERAADIIPQADVVALTGTALINHTMEDLLALCRPEAYVLVLGPSTPLSPVLLEQGVTGLAGTLVVDIETALRCVSQAATFRQMGGTRTVLMSG